MRLDLIPERDRFIPGCLLRASQGSYQIAVRLAKDL